MASLYGDAFAPAEVICNSERIQFDLFDKDRWPKHPYCSDDLLAGIYPRSLATALKRKYIQANPPHLRIWSIYDVDRAGGALSWEDAGLPPPNWAATNVENGHAHLVYGLSAPVLVDCHDMRQAPLRYLCAVEQAYRVALSADVGYSGLMTKNPAYPLWRVLQGPQSYYDLGLLSEYVDLPRFISKRNPEEIGLGRNVTCFDFLRKWAYKNIKAYKSGGLEGWNAWLSTCNIRALERNSEFHQPLEGNEVWHIAKSVAKWTWRTFDIEASNRRFSELQSIRGSKGGKASGLARHLASEDKRSTARIMRAASKKVVDIAELLNVHRDTVYGWLKDLSD